MTLLGTLCHRVSTTRSTSAILLACASLSLIGCAKPSPEAEPELSDVLISSYREFESEDAEIDPYVQQMLELAQSEFDLESDNVLDRSAIPELPTAADLTVTVPEGSDPSNLLPMVVAYRSEHTVSNHLTVQMLEDQTPVEPYSPNEYQRTFLDGEDCWDAGSCEHLNAENYVVKENLLMKIPYTMFKDYRWIELEDGEMGFIARTWLEESAMGDDEKSELVQAYSMEYWLPDGDSSIRVTAVWGETILTTLNVTDDLVQSTTRMGIDRNIEVQDDWLEEQLADQ